MLDDQLLERAAKQARDRLLNVPEADSVQEHVFSVKFEQQMERLIAQSKKERCGVASRWSRRAAAIVVTGFIGLSVCLMSVDAWRTRLFEMVERKHPEYSSITYEPIAGNEPVDLSDFKLIEYRPAYLPEGYRLTQQILNEHINWSIYTNAQNDSITFHQSVLGSGSAAIDTEDAELVKFDLNGEIGYKMSNKGTQFVLWSDQYYEYMLLTSQPMEEAIQIAQSVTISPGDSYHPPKLEKTLDERPIDYTVEQATENADVTIYQGGEIQNLEVLERFLENTQAGLADILCIADFDQDPLLTRELYFDGFRIHCTTDITRLDPAAGSHTVGEQYEKIYLSDEGDYSVIYVTDSKGSQPLLRYKNR